MLKDQKPAALVSKCGDGNKPLLKRDLRSWLTSNVFPCRGLWHTWKISQSKPAETFLFLRLYWQWLLGNVVRNVISYLCYFCWHKLIYLAQLIECIALACWVCVVSELIQLPFHQQLSREDLWTAFITGTWLLCISYSLSEVLRKQLQLFLYEEQKNNQDWFKNCVFSRLFSGRSGL